MSITKRLKKFWEDHHEALIVGGVGLATNVATLVVANKAITIMNGMRPYYYEVDYPENKPDPAPVIDLYVHQINGQMRHASRMYPNTDPRYVSIEKARELLSG